MKRAPVRLDALMRRILTELELLSHAPAGRWHTPDDGAQPTPTMESRPPIGPLRPPHEHYARRYAGCRTREQRVLVIRDALDELRAARYARRGIDLATREGREHVARDPRPVRILAHVYGRSARQIYRIRNEFKAR